MGKEESERVSSNPLDEWINKVALALVYDIESTATKGICNYNAAIKEAIMI